MRNHSIKISERQLRLWGMLTALMCLTLVSASAQTSTTSVSRGPSSSATEVRRELRP